MLKNHSFDNMILEEQISAVNSEIYISENVHALNEANDIVPVANDKNEIDKNNDASKKGFFEKAKQFFINIAKAISEAFSKFIKFFVNAHNKLKARAIDVQKYVDNLEVDASKKLKDPVTVKDIDPKGLDSVVNLSKNIKSSNFEDDFKKVKENLNKSDNLGTQIRDIASVRTAVKDASSNIEKLNTAAAAVKKNADEIKRQAKEGIQAAGKKDKNTVNEKKSQIARANKVNSLARTYISTAVKQKNQTLAASYSVAKKLSKGNTDNKKSDKKDNNSK